MGSKLRNLEPSLIQWIMTQTGLGPGIGEIKYVAPATSATSQYRTQLESMGVSSGDIFTSPADAYDAMVGYRNDVMLVAPGAYDLEEELTWDLQNTHCIGLGGPNVGGDWSEPNVVIYSDETDCASVITVTGANSIFRDLVISNYGNNAACLTAATINIYGVTCKNVAFQGVMTAGNDDTVAAASLYIGGAGMYPIIEDCVIGQDVWDEREGANSGMLRFSSATGRPNGGLFRRCRFLSRSLTATVALVALPAAQCIGRSWVMDQCHFSNFYDGSTNLNQVFYTVTGTQKKAIQLRNCSMSGFDSWQDGTFELIFGDMPIAEKSGGRMLEMSET